MVRMTLQVQFVLRTLLADTGRELYGLEFVEVTGLPPGTIYPILARIEAVGWIESRWEDIDERAAGRPRRRYYRLTGDGAVQATQALAAAEARRRRASTRGVAGDLLPGGLS